MDLKEYITYTIMECEAILEAFAQRNDEYKRVLNTPFEDLPTLLDDGTELLNTLVTARLKGEDIRSSQYTYLAVLEIEFEFDDAKNISFSDGKLCVLAEIANSNGWKDLYDRACACMYFSE